MTHQERWYRELLPLKNQYVVDVGANVGRLSEFFFLEGAGTNRVLSVEPIEENVREIAARISTHDASTRWTIAPCAASPDGTHVVLEVGRGEDAALNSFVVPDPHRYPAPDRVRAECKALSALAAGATLVKLDIEGHEYAVLDEALAKLPSVGAWAIELHMMPGRPLSATTRALAAMGYTVLGAGRRRSDPSGAWVSAEVPPSMEWDAVPVARSYEDGRVFKMLHIVAVR